MTAPDRQRWSAISQAFHWLIVALILVMAYLGLTMVDLPDTPHKIFFYMLHKSTGMTILVLGVLRLAWRLYAGRPAVLSGIPRWQAHLATLTHGALYVLLFALPLSGWLLNSSTGFPLRWFNLVNLPPLASRSDALHEVVRPLHEALFWALVVLALAHAAAAIYHHLFQRDDTLVRMLPRGWLRAPSAQAQTEHPHA
ncbi:cytochrome b [Cognatiluteimonas telluris]|jgi:cytochrome b561|uniref:cytochrome b n=1 Tax=Cognatiluteimonas telluris TaxID=1104775 RepID=UPI00140D7590|nr:cytochrome b [Lysobacter telluris]